MNKLAIITGATSGIGRATSVKLASMNHNLIITGRRESRLDELASELEKEHSIKVKTLTFDVRDNPQTEKAIGSLTEEWTNIDILINNAGLAAGADPIQDGLLSDWNQMIDTNIKGLLHISKLIIPLMINRGKGHIVNISSIAGKEVYANGNVYCASKHAVEAITKGMRIDLLKHGIKVSSVAPGMVDTEFSLVRYHGNKTKADEVYKGMTPLFAEDIADTIEFIITRPLHVNINDILVMPTAQASAFYNYRKE